MGSTAKQRASVHARRSWTCRCGRKVWGNGGKSSHQRACKVWQQYLADREARHG